MVKYHKFHDLDPNVTYYVQVRAKGIPYETQDSPWSELFSFVTDDDANNPSPASGIVLEAQDKDVAVYWTASASESSVYFRDYKVDFYDNASPGTKYTLYTESTTIHIPYNLVFLALDGNITTLGVDVYARNVEGDLSTVLSGNTAVGDYRVAKIDDLTDVDTTTTAPTTGQFLEWDGTNWIPNSISIDEMTDVDTTTAAPTTGQFLEWDGTNWIPNDIYMTEIFDVDLVTTPIQDGEVLVWDNGAGKFVPGVGAAYIDDLLDVDTTTVAPTTGQFLKWDGTNWIPDDAAQYIDDLLDVDTTTVAPTTGQFLKYDGAQWIPDDAAQTLNDLTDVDVSTTPPNGGQALVYDDNSSTWVPGTVAATGGGGGTAPYSETFGDGASTNYVITHNMDSQDLVVVVKNTSTNELVEALVTITGNNTIELDFESAPAVNSRRVTIFAAGGNSPELLYPETIGDGIATEYTITHNLNSRDIHVTVRDISVTPEVIVQPDVEVLSLSQIKLIFANAPATDSHRVVVSTGSSTASIDNLNDVTISGANEGDVLTYQSGVWTAAVPSGVSLGLVIALGG